MEDISPSFIVAFVSGSSIILAIIYKPSLIENLLGIKMYQMGRINSWLDPIHTVVEMDIT